MTIVTGFSLSPPLAPCHPVHSPSSFPGPLMRASPLLSNTFLPGHFHHTTHTIPAPETIHMYMHCAKFSTKEGYFLLLGSHLEQSTLHPLSACARPLAFTMVEPSLRRCPAPLQHFPARTFFTTTSTGSARQPHVQESFSFLPLFQHPK